LKKDDIVGGTDQFRQKLIQMFYRLEQQQQNASKNGNLEHPSKKWFSLPENSEISNSITKKNEYNESSDHDADMMLVQQTSHVNTRTETAKLAIATTRVIVEEPEDSVGLL
jgi:hypothetical protein